MTGCPFQGVLERTLGLSDGAPSDSARREFPLMPVGQPCDMGHDNAGVPLLDPRLFDSPEFQRNPYPYYRILRNSIGSSMTPCTMRIG